MKNPNAPKKNVEKTVEPIRKLKNIRNISKMLADNPRNHLLFTIGINNGLRLCDLLRLQVRDVQYLEPGESVQIIESKTGKRNVLMINTIVHKSLQKYFKTYKPEDNAYLFASAKTGNPLTVPSCNRLIKQWTSAINLKGRYGAHSLRKTWGYIQRVEFNTSWGIICKRFMHSHPAVTMRYLGITDKEVDDVLLHEIG
jgi:integrase